MMGVIVLKIAPVKMVCDIVIFVLKSLSEFT